ncbi:MAG: hypothetical protein ACM3ZQ_04685 [Bacillota bacterium]
MEEVLRKVKDAENAAKAELEKAKASADKLINDARLEAARMLEDGVKSARSEAEKLKAERVNQVTAKVANLRQTNEAERRQIGEGARKQLPQEVKLVMERIVTRDGSR